MPFADQEDGSSPQRASGTHGSHGKLQPQTSLGRLRKTLSVARSGFDSREKAKLHAQAEEERDLAAQRRVRRLGGRMSRCEPVYWRRFRGSHAHAARTSLQKLTSCHRAP